MVQEQLMGRDIIDQGVLKAMRSVPREKFVPHAFENLAYTDGPLPIGHEQTISQPYIVALMCQLFNLKGTEKVLDVGTGSGYQAAVLSLLAKKVISVEIVPELATTAQDRLHKLGYTNVTVITGDGSQGIPNEAPFDAIVSAAAAKNIPPAWIKQLSDGGRIVMPIASILGQELVKITKSKGRLNKEFFGGVAFVPLV